MGRKKKANSIPLIIEPHPSDYNGYPFITLIQYCEEHYLTIIDNSTGESIKAFVLDLCGAEKIDESSLIEIANNWYKTKKNKHPLSIEFAKHGLTEKTSKIYKNFNVEYVKRVIGPLPKFPMGEAISIKKRKKKTIPTGIKIVPGSLNRKI